MASSDSLVALFGAIAQNLDQDRQNLNQLDADDGDVGDNMAENFGLITDVLDQFVQRQGPQADAGAALAQAAEALRRQGRGATAPIYAQGLEDAAQRLHGRAGFSLDDVLPLLEGLMRGTQQASGVPEGEGSMMDVILPSVLAYLQAKQSGASAEQALLEGLMGLRRGATGTARSSRGFGRGSGRDTKGQLDPGAAGAATLLEGLFGALLNGALRQGQAPAQPPARPPTQAAPPQRRGGDIGDLLGELFREQRPPVQLNTPKSQV
jgi:dihydroxyacetone kinase-like protein